MRRTGSNTKYPGVYKVGPKTYRVRGKVRDPKTGKTKEVDRIINNVTPQQAAHKRSELLAEANERVAPAAGRVRVGEYAKSWIESKTLKLAEETSGRYATALDLHILPTLGDYYFDALTKADVQRWVDSKLREVMPDRQRKFSVQSVHGWFRVLRTMTNDAIEDLELSRDPTRRISFPEIPEPEHANSLTADELSRFLQAMREHYPQHYGLAVLLAYTGLRFCHGSALRWDDWDQEQAVLRVMRKQIRGKVGPISRKKRAPREYPIEPAMANVLREHQAWMKVNDWPGCDSGWMFPNSIGELRTQSSLDKAWKGCLARAEITRRFTVHGLRYTFTDLVREAHVDAVVRRALTGHVTEAMQRHYSNVDLAEKRTAVAGVLTLAPLPGQRGFTPAEKVSLRSDEPSQVGTLVGTAPESDNGQLRGSR